jgi:hypothetical protein
LPQNISGGPLNDSSGAKICKGGSRINQFHKSLGVQAHVAVQVDISFGLDMVISVFLLGKEIFMENLNGFEASVWCGIAFLRRIW